MAMLASDLANPEFVNPLNPDAQLFVEFFLSKIIDKWASDQASAEQGRTVKVYWKERKIDPKDGSVQFGSKEWEVPYIRIMRPGDKFSEIVRPCLETDKMRWPAQWQQFEISQGISDTQAANIPGWKVDDWPFVADKSELLRDMKHARFYTVELLAGASDAQVQKMGTGGLGFRAQARKDLAERHQANQQAELASRDRQIKDLLERVAAMERKGK